jgi:predicted RNase H-like nuclease
MWIIGIDLAGPSNRKDTALAAFQERGNQLHLYRLDQGWDDAALVQWIQDQVLPDSLVVGLDAPLSYNNGGGDRPSDKALRQRAIALGLPSGTIMAPTFTRMAYLTLRGITVARLLESLYNALPPSPVSQIPHLQIAEVHPATCLALAGAPIRAIIDLKRQAPARTQLLQWLQTQGLQGLDAISQPTDHQVAACGAALGAWQWSQNRANWLWPKALPFHPYDFAC